MCEKADKLLENDQLEFCFRFFTCRHAKVKSKLDTHTHLRRHNETHTDEAHREALASA